MTWIEDGRAWVAAPAESLNALANDGFEKCKREMTTSRGDCWPVDWWRSSARRSAFDGS
jgi:hypothetical protein